MPMDRLSYKFSRIIHGGGLALALVASGSGCRSTKPEVPPHRPFLSGVEGAQAPASSLTNPSSTMDGMPPVNVGGSQYGTPANNNTKPYGAPTNNAYGGIGNSTLGSMPGGDATRPGLGPVNNLPGGNSPITGIPQAGTGPLGPGQIPSGLMGAPTQDPGAR
jgi:hypothetical protein